MISRICHCDEAPASHTHWDVRFDGMELRLESSYRVPVLPTGDLEVPIKTATDCLTASALEGRTGQGFALQGIMPDLPVWLL